MDVNQESWELWLDIQTQWRAGGFGLIGLDYAEVRQAAHDLDIDLSRCVKSKIQALERYELNRANTRSDDDQNSIIRNKQIPKKHR